MGPKIPESWSPKLMEIGAGNVLTPILSRGMGGLGVAAPTGGQNGGTAAGYQVDSHSLLTPEGSADIIIYVYIYMYIYI